jgi:hypothetical protein
MIFITSEARSDLCSFAHYYANDLLSLVSAGWIEEREKPKVKRRRGHIVGQAQGLIDQVLGLRMLVS